MLSQGVDCPVCPLKISEKPWGNDGKMWVDHGLSMFITMYIPEKCELIMVDPVVFFEFF